MPGAGPPGAAAAAPAGLQVSADLAPTWLQTVRAACALQAQAATPCAGAPWSLHAARSSFLEPATAVHAELSILSRKCAAFRPPANTPPPQPPTPTHPRPHPNPRRPEVVRTFGAARLLPAEQRGDVPERYSKVPAVQVGTSARTLGLPARFLGGIHTNMWSPVCSHPRARPLLRTALPTRSTSIIHTAVNPGFTH